jgi:hypothetical protein
MAAHEHIATYLNDHLAGAAAALELLEHLESTHAGTPLEDFFGQLRSDVATDRQELEATMERLQVAPGRLRRVTAWVAEKVTELKLKVDDRSGGALRLLEALEVLLLGIEGKRAMWRALAAAAKSASGLHVADYGLLIKRAEAQLARVEEVRLEAAQKALAATAP